MSPVEPHPVGSEGLLAFDGTGRVRWANPRALELLRVDRAGIERFDPEAPPPARQKSPLPFVANAALTTLRTGEALSNLVLGWRLRDGSTTWLAVSTKPSANGSVDVSVIDVTEVREAAFAGSTGVTQRDLVQRSPLAIVAVDEEEVVQSWNPAATGIFGWSEREILGQPQPLLPGGLGALAERRSRGRDDVGLGREVRMLRRDGTAVEVTVHVVGLANPGGSRGGMILLIGDNSHRKAAERALRESEIRHRSLVEQLPLATFVMSADGEFTRLYSSPQVQSLLDLRPVTTFDEWLAQVHPDDRERLRIEAQAALTAGLPRRSEYRVIDRHNRQRWLREEATPLPDADGGGVLQGFLLDITEQRAAARLLERHAFHDEQTGLPNRAYLAERMATERATANHQGRRTATVAVLELDRFPQLNNILGRDAGDEILRAAGERLQAALGDRAIVARMGGAKFAAGAWVHEQRDGEGFARVMLAALEPAFTVSQTPVRVDARAGVASLRGRAFDGPRLINQADAAVAQASLKGRTLAVYSPRQDRDRREELVLASELPAAIERDQLQLEFQPILPLSGTAAPRMEALVRWRNPRLGTISPLVFMPLVEETALIGPFSLWVMAAAALQWQDWHAQGHDLQVAVNISARNLEDASFVREAEALIGRASVRAPSLGIEITESSLVANLPRALDSLEALKAMGFSIAIDDFGTGYSSLSYLRQLDVDEVKIDRSFVSNMLRDRMSMAIVRSIIGLAHDLGLVVVAEGVEDEATRDALASLGCDFVQGHLIAPPLPAREVTGWLAAL